MRHLKDKGEFFYKGPSREILDTFTNPGVDYVSLRCSEFTSLCPITGQPDYSEVEIRYVPDLLCLESKSLKLYLGAYRMEGGFTEQLTKRICEDLKEVLSPKDIEVKITSDPRGGISIQARKELR